MEHAGVADASLTVNTKEVGVRNSAQRRNLKDVEFFDPKMWRVEIMSLDRTKLCIHREIPLTNNIQIALRSGSTMLQAGRYWVRIPTTLNLFNLLIPSSYKMTIGFTRSLTEMSTIKSLWGVKGGRWVRL
jgi:hypothetical protein